MRRLFNYDSLILDCECYCFLNLGQARSLLFADNQVHLPQVQQKLAIQIHLTDKTDNEKCPQINGVDS